MHTLQTLLAPWKRDIPSVSITGLCNDSRQLKSGEVFLAYPGAAVDGRHYIAAALAAGASAVIYDPSDYSIPSNLAVPCIAFPQLALHLSSLASHFFDYPARSMIFTGITGTNGKTTIAYQLAQAHGLLGMPAAYIGTLGHGPVNALQPLTNTTPDALQLQRLFAYYRDAGIRHICMEVSSHALCQHRVADIPFTQAIYTNLSHEHLDYHHTMTAYAAAKAQLFAFPQLKVALINQDDAYAQTMRAAAEPACQVLTYGIEAESDVGVSTYKMDLARSELDVVSPWGEYEFAIQPLGKFNVYNSLAVFGSLCAHGYPAATVAAIMPKLCASPGRMEVVASEPCVIVDYAHTPDALKNVLMTIKQIKAESPGKIWVIFGCGGDRDPTKRPLMGRIASEFAHTVIITSDNPRTEGPLRIIEDINAGLLPEATVLKIPDRKQAIQHALAYAAKEDTILIAGKGHETYQIIGTAYFDFSDQAIVKEWFSTVSFIHK